MYGSVCERMYGDVMRLVYLSYCLFFILGRIVPSVSSHPWSDISDFSGNIHMGIYVYRVTGLQPGYYMLLRPDQQGMCL